jgi:hippurate hydrolase
MPEDRMPVVTVQESEMTPAVFNTEKLTAETATVFTQRFGADRVIRARAVMGGEDFGRYYLADKTMESTIFWVGATPRDAWDRVSGDTTKLPSTHSPFYAPDAEGVIATATEAMSALALDILRK